LGSEGCRGFVGFEEWRRVLETESRGRRGSSVPGRVRATDWMERNMIRVVIVPIAVKEAKGVLCVRCSVLANPLLQGRNDHTSQRDREAQNGQEITF
jgi:hypothetical protein